MVKGGSEAAREALRGVHRSIHRFSTLSLDKRGWTGKSLSREITQLNSLPDCIITISRIARRSQSIF